MVSVCINNINMQLSFFFFMVAVAFVVAVPNDPPYKPVFQTVKSDFTLDPAGPYKFGFETENAIVRDEVGELKSIKNEEGKDEDVVVVRGSYAYPGEDGKPLSIQYYADETGFHAEGAHIPVAPIV